MSARAVASALVAGTLLWPSTVSALTAGASSVEVELPAGAPLAGYGSFPRRAWMPDVIGRYPNAFWFNPSSGVHDPLRVRALAI